MIDAKNIIIAVLIFIILTLGILNFYQYNNPREVVKYITPVEEIEQIDSLVKANDSIKIVINNLDSIKDAKIIEVQSLSADSTVSVFYELVNE